MAATITTTGYIITPTLVLGYSTSRASRNVVHQVIGKSAPVITLRPAALRTGTLSLFFDDRAQAQLAVAAHSAGTILTLTEPDVPGVGMQYVLSGNVGLELDQSAYVWKVSADYQEVI